MVCEFALPEFREDRRGAGVQKRRRSAAKCADFLSLALPGQAPARRWHRRRLTPRPAAAWPGGTRGTGTGGGWAWGRGSGSGGAAPRLRPGRPGGRSRRDGSDSTSGETLIRGMRMAGASPPPTRPPMPTSADNPARQTAAQYYRHAAPACPWQRERRPLAGKRGTGLSLAPGRARRLPGTGLSLTQGGNPVARHLPMPIAGR